MSTYAEKAFSSAITTGGTAQENAFDSWEHRQIRYAVMWAHFQNNAYRDINLFATSLKTSHSLYPHIRDIYNPTFRIGTFHQNHLWAGVLDMEAGNGEDEPSCWPIMDAEQPVRDGLSQLWRVSKMDNFKNLYALTGAVLGDVFIKVVDDAFNERVYLERVDPRHVPRVRKNSLGEVTAYTIRYPVLIDEEQNKWAMYEERADLIPEGGGVRFQTLADDVPHAWDGISSDWIVDYPFVPFVHILHNDVGDAFGWPEAFPKLSTMRELDDITSKVSDQIRKMVDSIWLFSGVKKPRRGTAPEVENANIGRDEVPAIYAPDPASKPHPLVAPLDLMASLEHIKDLMSDIENSFPELRVVSGTERTSGDISGRALLITRQEVEDKMRERRVMYNTQLILAHRMGLFIGGQKSYEGFQGFGSVEGLEDEAFYHTIGSTNVFTTMETERMELEKQLWINAALAQRVGVSLEIFLRREGWSEEKVTEIINSEEYKLRQSLMVLDSSPDFGGRPVGEDSLDLPDEAQLDPNKPFSDFGTSN